MTNSISPFSRTLRSLAKDRPRSAIFGLVGLALALFLWTWWFVAAQLPLYLVSSEATIDARKAAQPLVPHHSGRIVAVEVEIGDRVEAGDPLIRLDRSTYAIELGEAESNIGALELQIEALSSALRSEQRITGSREEEIQSALAAARQEEKGASATARIAAEELERLERLADAGLTSAADLSSSRADLERAAAAEEAARQEVRRLESEARRTSEEQVSAVQRIRRELAELGAILFS